MNKRRILKPILTYSAPVFITMKDFEEIFNLKYYGTPMSTEKIIDIYIKEKRELIASVWRENRKEIIEAYNKWEKEYTI